MKESSIEWCDSTINPIMGCIGCELWPTIAQLVKAILTTLANEGFADASPSSVELRCTLEGLLPSDVYHARRGIAARLITDLKEGDKTVRRKLQTLIEHSITDLFKCYAGFLHLRHGKDATQPDKHTNKGYAPKFEAVTEFPGRMKEAARWSDLTGADRPGKPWLNGLPRLIFVSDMGDLLSPEVSFGYIKQELIDNVVTNDGSRHLWLWLTKQPKRMRKFFEWLEAEHGVTCPGNIVCMTSVTSQRTVWRARELQRIKCKCRGLSVEPLWTSVQLPLDGMAFVIVGGESGLRYQGVAEFKLAWAREVREQCRAANVAYFLKQLGSHPVESERPLKLNDGHGGNWDEWPSDLKVRQMPDSFKP